MSHKKNLSIARWHSEPGRRLAALPPSAPPPPPPCKAHLSGRKGRQGEEGKDSTVTHRKQVVHDESRRRCRGGRPFLSSPAAPLLSLNKWKMYVEALPFPASGPVASGWCCDWSWMDRLQTDRKGRAPWKGPGGWPSHLQENRVQAARMNVYVCVCVRACELNLISSARLTMRGNKREEWKKTSRDAFDCILGRGSVSREEKKRTPARSCTYRSQKGWERKKLVSTRKVHLPHFFYPKGKKSELDLGLQPSISASQLPGSFWWGWTRAGAPVAPRQGED